MNNSDRLATGMLLARRSRPIGFVALAVAGAYEACRASAALTRHSTRRPGFVVPPIAPNLKGMVNLLLDFSPARDGIFAGGSPEGPMALSGPAGDGAQLARQGGIRRSRSGSTPRQRQSQTKENERP